MPSTHTLEGEKPPARVLTSPFGVMHLMKLLLVSATRQFPALSMHTPMGKLKLAAAPAPFPAPACPVPASVETSPAGEMRLIW